MKYLKEAMRTRTIVGKVYNSKMCSICTHRARQHNVTQRRDSISLDEILLPYNVIKPHLRQWS